MEGFFFSFIFIGQDGDYACAHFWDVLCKHLTFFRLNFTATAAQWTESFLSCSALLQMLTAVWFPSCFPFNVSEPTDHQPAGLRREEDDPNLRLNPNPRCHSAKLCTPTMLRTQTSSASTLTTSSTSSKRVSVRRNGCCNLYIVKMSVGLKLDTNLFMFVG